MNWASVLTHIRPKKRSPFELGHLACQAFGERSVEVACVLFLNKDFIALGSQMYTDESVESVGLAAEPVIREAVALSADYVALAHNHPSGDPRPSASDVNFTADFSQFLRANGILLYDHFVLGHGRWTSMRFSGYITS